MSRRGARVRNENAPAAPQLALPYRYAPHHVVLLSGGHSSARVAIEVARRYGTRDLVLLNHDIHARSEDADVKRFKREIAAYLGLPITYANHPQWDTMDQFDVVRAAGAFKGANGHVLCTHYLKTKPFLEWLHAHADPAWTVTYYGFDANEEHRIRRRSAVMGAQGWRTDYPLALWPSTIASTREIGIEPPLTYSTFKHANCAGCLKAGRQHWFVVYVTRPDIWQRAKDAEEDIGYTILNGISLEELEPLFAEMVRAGVTPTERVPQQAFWAGARKAVRHLPVLAEEEATALPCECVFRRTGRPALPPCTCLAPPGEPHTLACERVWGVAA